MDFQQFIGVLRARWKFIVVTLLIGSFLTVGLAMSRAAEYASTGRIFIAVPDNSAQVNDYLSTYLVAQRTASYAELAKDPVLLQKVIDRTGLQLSRSELSARITTKVVTNTQIVEVRATGLTPVEARDLAEAEITELVALVNDFEKPTSDKPAAVVARSTGTPLLNPVPVGVPLAFVVAIGVILSFLAGIVGALIKDLLDISIKSRQDVEHAVDLPVISALPHDPSVAKDAHSAVAPGSPLAEGFRVLRANLRFADLDSSGQMILVTSALPNEGKTLTAVNLAQSLAATGQSVLLIDCDLRSPSVAANLGLENAVGMLSVLLGHISLSDAVQAHSSGLDVLPTGPRPPNPSEVLETDAVGSLLNVVREAYDVIVIDAPPILPVADTSTLVRHVDGVLLVARYGRTRKDVLRLAAERILGLNGRLYGVVLNGIPRRGGGGYGYGYGYGYGATFERPEISSPRPAQGGGGRRRVGDDPAAHEVFR
ncbi:polysaccharide biosynthesis tyrosine autokinase [Aeromicrobium sp.]|uniref:polysaccharide biosynthesis tyrosine autokinase n=1 Tax=Aeromicrobium sp. TaxID=1871063 RepID=UPI002FCB9A7A